MKKFNWQIWAGFVLSVFAFISYPTIFVEWPVTRNFPWANILLFIIAMVLVAVGIRKAFGPGRKTLSRIGSVLLSALSFASLAFFIFMVFVMGRWLPASTGAPTVGAKVPDFTLADTSGRQVSLTELTSTPAGGDKTRGVLLVFYRGYW